MFSLCCTNLSLIYVNIVKGFRAQAFLHHFKIMNNCVCWYLCFMWVKKAPRLVNTVHRRSDD